MRSMSVVIVWAWVTAGCAHVQPAHSWPDITRRLNPSQHVVVTDAQGSDVRGQLANVSPESLTLRTDSGLRRFEAGSVARIRRDGDPLWNGLAIGAAVGVLGVILPDNKCTGQPIRCGDTQIPARVAFLAASTAAGVAFDAMHRDRTVVYQSPGRLTVRIVPTMSPGGMGLRVAVISR
jgi:hypothetical protein